MSADRWLSIHQVAELLGVSKRTIERLVDAAPPGLVGEPVSVGAKARRMLRWRESQLAAWVEAVDRHQRPRAPAALPVEAVERPLEVTPTRARRRKVEPPLEAGEGGTLLARVRSRFKAA